MAQGKMKGYRNEKQYYGPITGSYICPNLYMVTYQSGLMGMGSNYCFHCFATGRDIDRAYAENVCKNECKKGIPVVHPTAELSIPLDDISGA